MKINKEGKRQRINRATVFKGIQLVIITSVKRRIFPIKRINVKTDNPNPNGGINSRSKYRSKIFTSGHSKITFLKNKRGSNLSLPLFHNSTIKTFTHLWCKRATCKWEVEKFRYPNPSYFFFFIFLWHFAQDLGAFAFLFTALTALWQL